MRSCVDWEAERQGPTDYEQTRYMNPDERLCPKCVKLEAKSFPPQTQHAAEYLEWFMPAPGAQSV